MAYEAVIGLECHIQLATRTKMFCDCPAEFGAAPNTNVCPVCLGLPGALPRANRAAIEAALRLGLALGCELRGESVFARKNYFYPDMPKNYQITQYDRPLCEGGALPVSHDGAPRSIPLIRVHVEEDTGKSFHPERHGDRRISRVDFNRAGVPLLELVTQPAFRDPSECAAFLTTLRRLVRWLGISDGDMEKGHLRCDANVSLRPAGSEGFGTKTELKNLNSIKGVEKGLLAEIARQREVLEGGGQVHQATLLYDADGDRLAVMRSKEHAHDYRYFPEPDLPVLRVEDAWIEAARAALPELPWARVDRFVAQHGISASQADLLCSDPDRADHFERYVRAKIPSSWAANWILNAELALANKYNLTPAEFERRMPVGVTASLFEGIQSAQVTATAAKSHLDDVFRIGVDPGSIFVTGRKAVGSREELLPLVLAVLDEHPGPVAQFLAGKTTTLGFLVGQVMKKSGGQAVPQTVRELLEAELARRAAAAG